MRRLKDSEGDFPKEENIDYDLPDEFRDDSFPTKKKKYKEENIIMEKERPKWKVVYEYMSNSSLFIFHKDWRFRKFLIDLIVSPETLMEYRIKKREDAMFQSGADENMNSKMDSKVSGSYFMILDD